MNKAYAYYKGMKPGARGAVLIGGLAVVGVIIFQIIKQIKADAKKRQAQASLADSRNELQNVLDNGMVPTFPVSTFKGWAEQIQNQFDGCDFSTPLIVNNSIYIPGLAGWSGSANKMYNIISQFKNDADFLSLIDAYDIRTYDQCGLFTGNVTGNLYFAIQDELTEDEIKGLNQVLAAQHITYRF